LSSNRLPPRQVFFQPRGQVRFQLLHRLIAQSNSSPPKLTMAWLDSLLLRSSKARIRCKAVEHLAGSSRPSDTELLCASLQDADAHVRCAAVAALARTNAPGTEASLVSALKDPSFEVRAASARALGRLGAVGSTQALAACLKDLDAAVRIAAADALRSLNWKPSTREEVAWFDIALGNTPPAVPLKTAPEDTADVPNQDTAFYRRLAAEELKARTDPHRIASLLADLAGNDLLARLAAIHDLGQVTHPQVTQALLALFRHRDREVRLAAAQTLARRDDLPPVHFLGLLQDPSPEVRLAAVQFLGRIHHEQIVQVLSPLLSDPSAQVREATAMAMCEIGHPSAIEPLVMSLAEQDEQTRRAVERTLEHINPAWRHSEAAALAG